MQHAAVQRHSAHRAQPSSGPALRGGRPAREGRHGRQWHTTARTLSLPLPLPLPPSPPVLTMWIREPMQRSTNSSGSSVEPDILLPGRLLVPVSHRVLHDGEQTGTPLAPPTFQSLARWRGNSPPSVGPPLWWRRGPEPASCVLRSCPPALPHSSLPAPLPPPAPGLDCLGRAWSEE